MFGFPPGLMAGVAGQPFFGQLGQTLGASPL
jgi:hypothetical protein